jgi:hypothetical protein
MAEGIFEIIYRCDAKLFASMIPQGIDKPSTKTQEYFLRKDHVFFLERYYHFLESKNEDGLIVMDETDKASDRNFVSKLQCYFSKTQQGRLRSTRILPSPFFVSSDMAYSVQAADLAIYCINWGFRLESSGINSEVRPEIREKFSPWINKLQFHGERIEGDKKYQLHGIVFVPDPYESRTDRVSNKKGETSTLASPQQVMPASSLA